MAKRRSASAVYQLGIGKHWRTSSASAFLQPVAHRPNLTVITGAQVSKVTFRGDVATGVEWIKNAQHVQR